MKNILKIEDATLAYDDNELFSAFNMEVKKGEIACVLGESGRGKTSLLNAVLGFVILKKGRVIVNNIELTKETINQVRKQIAWIPQELALPSIWVEEMVKMPFQLKNNQHIPFSEEKVLDSFHELGLDADLYQRKVSEISGGQRQRIMIATSVLLEKPLLVVDEPTSALDSESSHKVFSFLKQHTNAGLSVLAVSHDKSFSSRCDQQIHL